MKITTVITTLAGLAFFSFASPAQAQYKAVGDDGIAASPKLRDRLNERKGLSGAALEPSHSRPMACPKCKDSTARVRDYDGKGLGARALLAGGPPTKLVATHLCEGCGTDWKSNGVGKARQLVATHKCTGCGADNLACCNTTKGSTVASKGMEKKFEVAPLK